MKAVFPKNFTVMKDYSLVPDVTPILSTDKYILYEGTGGSKGAYLIRRMSDNAHLDWYTGEEARTWAKRLLSLTKKQFDVACEKEFD